MFRDLLGHTCIICKNNKFFPGDLSDLNITAIAPVDLNSLHCRNARILSDFYKVLGDENKSNQYDEIANIKNITLAELFWDEDDGIWYDLNIHNNKKRK